MRKGPDTISSIRIEHLDLIEDKLDELQPFMMDVEVRDMADTLAKLIYKALERKPELEIEEARKIVDRLTIDLLLTWLSHKPIEYAEKFRYLVAETLASENLTLEQWCADSEKASLPKNQPVVFIAEKLPPVVDTSCEKDWEYRLCEQHVSLRFGKIIAQFLSEIAVPITQEYGHFSETQFTELGNAIIAELMRLNNEFLDYREVIYTVMLQEARKVFKKSAFLTLLDHSDPGENSN